MTHQTDQHPDGIDARGLRVAIVVSRYHAAVTGAMRDAAEACYLEAGGDPQSLRVVPAAGSMELVPLCRALAEERMADAIVALGCIVEGETSHDRHIAAGVVRGLTDIMVRTGLPVGFGVLTCQTMAQARARAGGSHGNKGLEAMAAALHTAATLRALSTTPAGPARLERA